MDLSSLLGLGEVSFIGLLQDFLYTMFLWLYNLITGYISLPVKA